MRKLLKKYVNWRKKSVNNDIIKQFEEIKSVCTTEDGRQAVEKCEQAYLDRRPLSLADCYFFWSDERINLDSYTNKVPIEITIYGYVIDTKMYTFDKQDLRNFINEEAEIDGIESDKMGARGELRFPYIWQKSKIQKFIDLKIKSFFKQIK